MSLDDIRKRIDEVDDAIVALLNERYALVFEVKKEKEETGKTIYDPIREEAALARMEKGVKKPFEAGMLRKIYSVIFAASRDLQRD